MLTPAGAVPAAPAEARSYWCEHVAHTVRFPDRPYPLAGVSTNSPRMSVRWMTERLDLLGAQAGVPGRTRIALWVADPWAPANAIQALAAGDAFSLVVRDIDSFGDELRHVLSAQPVHPVRDLPFVDERLHLMSSTPSANGDALREGDRAARELADALKLAGFTLPSLRGDFPSVTDQPLVQLGGASASLVRELAAWIAARA